MNPKIKISLFLLLIVCIKLNSCETTDNTEDQVENEQEQKTENDKSEIKIEQKQKPQLNKQQQSGGAGGGGGGGLSPGISDTDLDKLLMDKRYLTRQIKCALGQGACDPVGRRLKSLAPLVLRGACPKCTGTEKRQIQKTLAYIQKNYPKDWARLMATYSG